MKFAYGVIYLARVIRQWTLDLTASPTKWPRDWDALMLTDRIVVELFQGIEPINKLPWDEREPLGNLIAQRISLIRHKLSESAFFPLRQPEETPKLNPNSNFGGALRDWVLQFSPESRPGALALGLSVNYITEDEFKNFLDDCAAQIIEEKLKRAREGDISRKIVPYPLTERGDIFGKFVHLVHEPGTADTDVKWPGPLENFLFSAAHTAYLEAMGQSLPGEGYFDLGDVLRLILNKHFVILEDWSITGHSLGRDLHDFLCLLKALLGKREVQKEIERAGHTLPVVTAVLPFATEAALNRIGQIFSTTQTGFALRPGVVTGFKFEATNRLVPGLTLELLRTFKECAPSVEWRTVAERACAEYASKAKQCLATDQVAGDEKDLTVDEETLKYGWGKGGWTVVGCTNCPDNSLPLLWRPCSDVAGRIFHPLFPRVLSKETHAGTGARIRQWLQVAETDMQDKLAAAIIREAKLVCP